MSTAPAGSVPGAVVSGVPGACPEVPPPCRPSPAGTARIGVNVWSFFRLAYFLVLALVCFPAAGSSGSKSGAPVSGCTASSPATDGRRHRRRLSGRPGPGCKAALLHEPAGVGGVGGGGFPGVGFEGGLKVDATPIPGISDQTVQFPRGEAPERARRIGLDQRLDGDSWRCRRGTGRGGPAPRRPRCPAPPSDR